MRGPLKNNGSQNDRAMLLGHLFQYYTYYMFLAKESAFKKEIDPTGEINLNFKKQTKF